MKNILKEYGVSPKLFGNKELLVLDEVGKVVEGDYSKGRINCKLYSKDLKYAEKASDFLQTDHGFIIVMAQNRRIRIQGKQRNIFQVNHPNFAWPYNQFYTVVRIDEVINLIQVSLIKHNGCFYLHQQHRLSGRLVKGKKGRALEIDQRHSVWSFVTKRLGLKLVSTFQEVPVSMCTPEALPDLAGQSATVDWWVNAGNFGSLSVHNPAKNQRYTIRISCPFRLDEEGKLFFPKEGNIVSPSEYIMAPDDRRKSGVSLAIAGIPEWEFSI